jgi:uncharacterized protein
MKFIRVINQSHLSKNNLQLEVCDTFWSRFRGLMLRKQISLFEGILLSESQESKINSAIHMLFMRFAITVVWLNHDKVVVDKKLARQWALMLSPQVPAQFILELHPARYQDFNVGDRLRFEEV